MKERNIIDLGLLLPLLTALIFASIYFYELGYFIHFGIPKDLIEIEASKNSYLIFICSILFIGVLAFFQPLFSGIITLVTSKSKLFRIIMFTLLVLIFCFVYFKPITILYHKEILYPYISLFLGLFLLTFKKNTEIKEVFKHDFSLLNYINFSLAHSLGPILIISSIICILTFNIGMVTAETKNNFLVKKDKKTILIRKYSAYSIYGIPDSTTSKLQRVTIERGTSDIDTLEIFTK